MCAKGTVIQTTSVHKGTDTEIVCKVQKANSKITSRKSHQNQKIKGKIKIEILKLKYEIRKLRIKLNKNKIK
jgi:hypothetical protein